MNQFPQPTRPIDSYNLMQMPQSSTKNLRQVNYIYSYPTQYQEILESECVDPVHEGVDTTTTAEGEEKQAIEDLIRVISEWYQKLPESIRNRIDMTELSAATRGVNGGIQTIAQNFQRLRAEALNLNQSSRGIDGGDEELSRRLERFRIRTVEIGVVVVKEEGQEEEKKQ